MDFHYDGNLPTGIETSGSSNDILAMYGEIDQNVEFLETHCLLVDGGDRFGVASVAFDPHEELLWMGNQGGHVTSYYSSNFQKYTSFQVHASEDVRNLCLIDEGVLALTATSLRCQIRRGLPLFTYNSINMVEMQSMLQLAPNRLILGGHQDKLIDFNLELVKENGVVEAGDSSGCALLRLHKRYVCSGSPLGTITLRDPNSLKIEHKLETFNGSLSDFDIQGNLLVSCGFSNRQGVVSCDHYLKVYDLRMLRVVSPIQVVIDPLYLRFFPSISSRLVVVSALGQIQLVDTVSLSEPRLCLYQMNNVGIGAMCLTFDISSSSQAMCLGDSAGNIHLFNSTTAAQHTQTNEVIFNTYSRPSEHAPTIIDQLTEAETQGIPINLSFDDDTVPLSLIPMPVLNGNTNLASDWPEKLVEKVYRRLPGIDPEILRAMKMQGPIGYAPNPKNTKRNQVKYNLNEKHGVRSQLKLNDMHRGGNNGNGLSNNGSKSDGDSSLLNSMQSQSGFIAIPKRYRKIDAKFNTKLNLNGQDDIEQYNKTGLPGLESTLPNSYCNCMIQVLYYIEPLRVTLLSHTCNKEFCLTCELGFLFHMLDKSVGNGSSPCQPGNFLRAFRTVPEASALGLILNDANAEAKNKNDLSRLIQNWNRFILHQMHYEIFETKRLSIVKKNFMNKDNDNLKQTEPILIGEEQLPSPETTPEFIYNENDFPNIYGDSFLNQNVDENYLDDLNNIDNGKFMWIPQTDEIRDYAQITSSNLNSDETLTEQKENFNKTENSNQQQSDVKPAKHVEETISEISEIFGTKQLHINRCLKCQNEEVKESILLVSNLIYPKDINQEIPFTDVLARSLQPARTTPAWCEPCNRFTPTMQMRHLQSLPKIFAINCGLDNPYDKLFWQKQIDHIITRIRNNNSPSAAPTVPPSPVQQTTKPCRYGDYCARSGCRFKHSNDSEGTSNNSNNTNQIQPLNNAYYLYYNNSWIPRHIEMKLVERKKLIINKINDSDKVQQEELIESSDKTENQNDENKSSDEKNIISKRYNLMAVVCYINDDKRNLVSLIRLPNNLHNQNSSGLMYQWYLFNDISVTAVPAQEAVWFSLDWKKPCILYFADNDLVFKKNNVINPLTQDVFGQDKSLAKSGQASKIITFTPLSASEMPQPGELIGIDAEFVTLNQEEAELRSDGKLSTIKPSHMSVARITCVRGQGPMEGTPFIDDYISTQEQVVDYLTKFSGIVPGDLDANFSSKHLTTLKSTYQKLRFLQDHGVVFVGHGLQNDFRVINLVIPPEQIIDTVELFHLPHQRMVSLRFLAWHFLGTKIQSVTHDSAEDARTALQLYRKYKELQLDNKLSEALITLYETGKNLQWRVPDDDYNIYL